MTMLNMKRATYVTTPEELPTRFMFSMGMLQHQLEDISPSSTIIWVQPVPSCLLLSPCSEQNHIKKQKLPNLHTEIQLHVCTH